MRGTYRLWQWKHRKSRWPVLTAAELRTVITAAGARERVKPPHTRVRHRRTRLEAVALYRRRFGEADFLSKFGVSKMPPIRRMWLPGGYAWWKVRKWK